VKHPQKIKEKEEIWKAAPKSKKKQLRKIFREVWLPKFRSVQKKFKAFTSEKAKWGMNILKSE